MRFTWLLLVFLLPVDAWARELDAATFEAFKNKTVTQITFTGNNVTKEYVIRREMTIRVGEPLSLDALAESVVNLENLDIFSSVHVTPTDHENGVALAFQVREMPWIIPYLKFKYTEENGWSIGPTVSALNLLGRGIKLSAFVLFGGTETSSFVGNYPWITGNHLSLDLTLKNLTREDTLNEFEEHSYQFTPWVGTYIGKHGRLKGTVSWFQMNSDSTGRTLQPDNQDNFVTIAGSIGYDSRDSWTNPHKGWQNELQIGKTGGGLPGDGDSWRVIFDVRRFQPTTERQTLAIGALATLNTGTVNVDYPSYLMYRMGGANSIRGYTIDELGKEVYGQNQLIGTLEYQLVVMPFREYVVWKWSFRAGLQVAAFADWGSAWNEGQSIRDPARTGFGVGIRPLVPAVDMVRFDFGFSQDGDFVFNFGISPKFDTQRDRLR